MASNPHPHLQEGEVKYLSGYPGFKCQVPIKWALNELRSMCEADHKDRMAFMSRNYESLQTIASDFNKTAVRIVTIMQQPVPFVYFHLLKLMMVVVNMLIGTILSPEPTC